MPDLAHSVLSLVSSGALGIGLAVGLLLALVILLPPAERRRRIRAPAALLAAHALVLVGRLPLAPESSLARSLWLLGLFLLLTAIARAAFVLIVDVIFGARLARPLPRIFHDLLQGLVYAGVVLVTLRAAGVEPSSLLTTSALLTAVLGFAAQDTLGNLFSGLAIQTQRPFEVGDWIQYDPDPRLIGRVIEINWRTTTLLTNDEVQLLIPNTALAKSALRNFSKPSPLSRRIIEVQAPYEVSPRRVEEALRGVARGVPGVLAEPAPFVLTRGFADSGISYLVHFFIEDFARRDRIDSEVRQRVWHALHRAGISIPFPIRTVHLHQASAEAEQAEREARARRLLALKGVDFLAALPADALERLSALCRTSHYMAGEEILRQGDTGHELFILQSGEVAVRLARGEGRSIAEVARLGPGKFFGEMSLMTGEPRSATIQAIQDCELAVVDKASFQEILAAAPHLAERITEVLIERQAALEENLSARVARNPEERAAKSNALLKTIRQFFALRGG